MAKIIYETEEAQEISGPLKLQQNVAQIQHDALDQIQDLYVSMRETLDPQLAELKIKEAQLAEVNEQLQAALDDAYPHNQKGIRATDTTTIMFGAKGSATEITDKVAIIKIIGLDLFIELAKISVTDLDKYLTEDQKAKVTKKLFKNKRTVKWANTGKSDIQVG